MTNKEIVKAIAEKNAEIRRLKVEISKIKNDLTGFCKVGDVLTHKNGRQIRITRVAFDDDGSLSDYGGVRGVFIRKDGSDGAERKIYKWDIPAWPKESWEKGD